MEKAKAAEARTELVTKDPNASKEARKKEVPKRRNTISGPVERKEEKTRRKRRNAITNKDKEVIEKLRKELEKEKNEAPDGCCGK